MKYRIKRSLLLHLYTRLSEVAEYPANLNESRIGEMRCQWVLGNYDQAVEAAKKVILIIIVVRCSFIFANT